MVVQNNQEIGRHLLMALTCLIAAGCNDRNLEKSFFEKPAVDRVQRLRRYSLDEQYRIFRYGMDAKEPPAMGLAGPIADRGADAVPFLVNKLNVDADDIAVRDILLIFERMQTSRSYNVKADASLMSLLTSKVSEVKDKGWQDTCLKGLKEIREPK
jgi:hypothetical protein